VEAEILRFAQDDNCTLRDDKPNSGDL
jgi:hypothetical protein